MRAPSDPMPTDTLSFAPPSSTETDAVHTLLIAGKETEKRVRAMVEQVRGGIVGQSGLSEDDLRDPSVNARQVWALMKEERTALLAVLLENAWRTFKAEARKSPTGLMEFWSGKPRVVTAEMLAEQPDALGAITASQRNMTHGVLEQWKHLRQDELGAHADSPVGRAYRRSEELNAFAAEHDIHHKDSAFYLSNGFSGGLQIGYGVSRVIPQAYLRENGMQIPRGDYSRILQGSYARFFVRPAHMDQSVGIPLMNAPFKRCDDSTLGIRMDPSMVRLEGLSLSPVREHVSPEAAAKALESQVGCVALYAKDDETDQSVNRAFFDHFVSLVEEHHISRYKA